MAAPGTKIVIRDTPPPRSAPTATGIWFVAGLTERGPLAPVLITSMDSFTRQLGARVAYSVLYDALETYFREGGDQAYVSRVVGPAPVKATGNLFDQAGSAVPGDVSLIVTARSHGDWANAIDVEVVAGSVGGTFVLVVSDEVAGELERSPDLATPAAAVAWATASSSYIDLALGASAESPRVQAPIDLAGGTDDHANATDATWKTALDRFGSDLGPGQVSMPGRTTTQAHTDTLLHAEARNRRALLDTPDTPTVVTLTGVAVAQRAHGRSGALFGPWAVIPGLTLGTTRTVPYSAVQAGLIGRSDAAHSANVPAAGENGKSRFAIDLSQPAWSDADRETLNNAGVNVARLIYGGVRTYGYRTLTDPTDENWILFSNSRLIMAITAKANAIAERFVFSEIDGRGRKIGEFGGELVGALVPYYDAGSLFGDTPEQAFNVDVGSQVNTLETIAAGELHAVIALRISPFAELVVIEIVKVPVEETVA